MSIIGRLISATGTAENVIEDACMAIAESHVPGRDSYRYDSNFFPLNRLENIGGKYAAAGIARIAEKDPAERHRALMLLGDMGNHAIDALKKIYTLAGDNYELQYDVFHQLDRIDTPLSLAAIAEVSKETPERALNAAWFLADSKSRQAHRAFGDIVRHQSKTGDAESRAKFANTLIEKLKKKGTAEAAELLDCIALDERFEPRFRLDATEAMFDIADLKGDFNTTGGIGPALLTHHVPGNIVEEAKIADIAAEGPEALDRLRAILKRAAGHPAVSTALRAAAAQGSQFAESFVPPAP